MAEGPRPKEMRLHSTLTPNGKHYRANLRDPQLIRWLRGTGMAHGRTNSSDVKRPKFRNFNFRKLVEIKEANGTLHSERIPTPGVPGATRRFELKTWSGFYGVAEGSSNTGRDR